jgi:hypothetical protein
VSSHDPFAFTEEGQMSNAARDPRHYEVAARPLAAFRGAFHHPCFDD